MTPVTDEQVKRDHLDLEMLERPHLWPGKLMGARYVHLKSTERMRDNRPKLTGRCFIAAELTPHPPTAKYVIFVYDWTSDTPLDAKARHYATAEDICAAGWEID